LHGWFPHPEISLGNLIGNLEYYAQRKIIVLMFLWLLPMTMPVEFVPDAARFPIWPAEFAFFS